MIPTIHTPLPGVTLSHIRSHKFKTAALTVTLPISLNEDHWILNSILPGVLRQGCESYPTISALNRRLDELYATCIELRNQRFGENLALVLTVELLDDAYAPEGANVLEEVLSLLAQLLLHPKLEGGTFRKKAVDQEIRFALDSIRGEINNTRAYSVIRLNELMHKGNPNHLTLKEMEERIQLVEPKALTVFYREVICSAPMQISYMGSADASVVISLLKKYFPDGPRRDFTPVPPKADPVTTPSEVVEPMPVSQGKLAMGFRTGVCFQGTEDQTPTMLMLNEILGGSPASKLFLNVRERMNLCYYCSSSYHRYYGILTVTSGIDSRNFATAKEAILAQLKEIQNGEISAAEFEAARRSLENSCRGLGDNPLELQGFYQGRRFFGVREDPEDFYRRLMAVRCEDVVALSQGICLDTVYFIQGTATQEEPKEEGDET